MSEQRVENTLTKLKLLEMGEATTANEFDTLVQPANALDDTERILESDLKAQLAVYRDRYKAFVRNKKRAPANVYCKKIQRDVIESFKKACLATRKCENCGGISPTLRKDGFSKIFQKPLPKRGRKGMKTKVKSGLEAIHGDLPKGSDDEGMDIDDDDDGDEEEDGDGDDGAKEHDKYLAPSEVEAQLKLVWHENTAILDFIWSRAVNGGKPRSVPSRDGWTMFFMRAVLVPPNRFRPSAKVGDILSEHAQNGHLQQIIRANEGIKRILTERSAKSRDVGTGMGASMNGDAVSSEDDEAEAADVEAVAASSAQAGREKGMSDIYSLWITLQNAVNCYMDSAKDPNPLGSQSAASGIRQLLERKEGLFRQFMMGKRVNFCCRSVISPDPYLGTNEIGIPVHFARTLHYPQPVNEWNVKYLRTLVERGAHEYPGND
jgi:DNA-directed RNA polymerase I subunit RPA1